MTYSKTVTVDEWSYPGMTPQEAIVYERNRDQDSVLAEIQGDLDFVTEVNIETTFESV